MTTNKTIEGILRWYGEAVDSQGYEVPELDQAKAAITQVMLDIPELQDEDNYKPYLVVAHKLGLEANQTQARLIAQAVNHSKQKIRTAIKLIGGK